MSWQKEIDELDVFIDDADQRNAFDVADRVLKCYDENSHLLTADQEKADSIRIGIVTARRNLKDYRYAQLAGTANRQEYNAALALLRQNFNEFREMLEHASGSTAIQDKNYDLLCLLNFHDATNYFKSLVNGEKCFHSLVIRGPHENHGQRWLTNKLIHLYRREQHTGEPLSIHFTGLNLDMRGFEEELAKYLNITLGEDNRDALLKNELIKRTEASSQFIIIYNAYSFIHSKEYTAFRDMMRYFNKEINAYKRMARNYNKGKDDTQKKPKCIFMFVEEHINKPYDHTDDCIFWEKMAARKARQVKEFRFVDLGLTKSIDMADIDSWLDEIPEALMNCIKDEVDEQKLASWACDGNPRNVIPRICEEIGIKYPENEKLWIKY